MLKLLENENHEPLGQEEYANFQKDLSRAKSLVYLTDNCGEIVLDKLAIKILKEKYPAFAQTADSYMQSENAHECNMFIMKKEIYKDYCAWLFDILFETEKRIDSTWYSVEEYRVMGYLAERLCGIYYEWLKTSRESGGRIAENPVQRDSAESGSGAGLSGRRADRAVCQR